MTTIITRLFADHEKAAAAATELQSQKYGLGFPAGDITAISPPAQNEAADEQRVHLDIVGAGVPERDAAVLATRLIDGGSLIVVRAAWGRAGEAIEILEGFGPFESGPSSGEHNPGASEWHDAAPLSSLLGLPVIFSSAEMKSSLAIPALVGDDRMGSRSFGIPLLVSNDRSSTKLASNDRSSTKLLTGASPFSSLLHIPTLV